MGACKWRRSAFPINAYSSHGNRFQDMSQLTIVLKLGDITFLFTRFDFVIICLKIRKPAAFNDLVHANYVRISFQVAKHSKKCHPYDPKASKTTDTLLPNHT